MQPFNAFIKKSLVLIYGTVAVAFIAGLWLLLKCAVRVSHVGRHDDYAQRSLIACSWHAGLLPYFVGAMPVTIYQNRQGR